MRGSCPTHLVLCMRADKSTLRSPENIIIPDLNAFISLNESLTSVFGTYPRAKVIGICANTSMLNKEDAEDFINKLNNKTGVIVLDPVRQGVEELSLIHI